MTAAPASRSAVLPTGEQHVLRRGDAQVTVVEVGGGLRRYRAAGRDVLDGYDGDAMADWCRGQVLAPWPNRLRDGVHTWDGEELRLPLTEPERGTAIHGLVRWVAWAVAERAEDRLVLEHLLHPQPGYPFSLHLRIAYELSDAGLAVTTTATNAGPRALPYGEGHHPYVAAGAGRLVDDCVLRAPGRTRLETDDRGLPTAAVPVAGTRYDLRAGVRVADLAVDSCFTDLERDGDGRAWVGLTGPDGRGAALWLDGSYPYLQLFTGDAIPGPRRRQGLAVEPMTCPPDALRSGEGIRRLEPGESTSGSWGIVPRG